MNTLIRHRLVFALALSFVGKDEVSISARAATQATPAGGLSQEDYRKEGRNLTPPVFAYKRKYGNSITGGLVSRGDKASSFYGVYLCGDYTSKHIFWVTQINGGLRTVHPLGTVPQGLVSFGTDEAGEIYVVGYEGMIYQLDFCGSHFDEIKVE